MLMLLRNPRKAFHGFLKFLYRRLPPWSREALREPVSPWARKLRIAASGTSNPDDLSWHEFRCQVLSRRNDFKGTLVQNLTIDWSFPLYQRPQHLASALGRRNYLVIYRADNWPIEDVNSFREVSENVWLTNSDEVTEIEGAVHSFYCAAYAIAHRILQGSDRRVIRVYEYVDHIDPEIIG